MMTARGAIQRLVAGSTLAAICRPLVRGKASIFMLHRFLMPELGVAGHDPAVLREVLAALRREAVGLVSLEQIFEDLDAGRTWAHPVVAFTIDDGYIDQATVGASVFAEFDCPVTTFVTSGFLDGHLWFWWDRIEYVFRRTRERRLAVILDDVPLRYEWSAASGWQGAKADFTNRCKEVPEPAKLEAIDALAVAGGVTLPAQPPPEYAPMSWNELRRCEAGGMRFGPHTVTHPVLAQTGDDQSRSELTESWMRLVEEATHPVPIFCYPNGRVRDFGPREVHTLRELGIHGGVVGETGYASHQHFVPGTDLSFQVPRFAYHESVSDMMQLVNGVERLKQLLKGRT